MTRRESIMAGLPQEVVEAASDTDESSELDYIGDF